MTRRLAQMLASQRGAMILGAVTGLAATAAGTLIGLWAFLVCIGLGFTFTVVVLPFWGKR